ncbi:hypothetical protein HPB50_002568 [Hyalomma asiaticum]|uniref:Uncharacterized protein n=1 Tax=Hyalomma asiaticum TaxID=266040 RepID=A0ACB7TBT0_HYAAI|nr:hypothetical protein HPB50_002568 [Hyalomma asiaticum]
MTGNCCFEGLRYKRPMVPACIALLLALALASAAATPRQDQREARLAQLDPEVEAATEDYDVEFIEGRIVGGKPVSLLRKRAHGGGTASKTSSSASGEKAQGTKGSNDSTSSSGSSEAKRPPSKATRRPIVGDGLRPESSSWRPTLSGPNADNVRPNLSPGNRPDSSKSNGGSSVGSQRPQDFGSDRPRETNAFDNEHRGGSPNQNRESGHTVPWNHQGVSPGYPAPITPAYTDDESPSYIPNPPATPNTYPPHNEQRPSLSSSPSNSAGSQGGVGIIVGHPPANTFSQSEGAVNRPSVASDEGNVPRQGGGLIIGSPPMNGFGGRPGDFNGAPPPQELDQARRGVINQQDPQQGVGSFGLPPIPSNPFVPANPGFHGPGSLPLPFGAGLFNPGLVNIQKAVENAAAGVLGVNPTAANVFGRTSTFGQMTSFGFTDRK